MKIERLTDLKGMVDTMKLIKLPFKIFVFPVIALLWLVTMLAKVTVKIVCYIAGPVMLVLLGLIIYVITKQRWDDLFILGCMEGICILILFGVTWMIANVQDVNELLIEFIKS